MEPTPLQTAILTAVAKYRFMTNSQLGMILTAHPDSIRKATRALSHVPKPLLIKQSLPVHSRLGRLENVHRLSPQGASVLAELEELAEPPLIPKSGAYALDIPHRKAVIDFRIRLDLIQRRRKFNIETWDNYFDKSGANHRKGAGKPLQSRTRISFRDGTFFIPDTLLVLRADRHRLLFALEMIRGEKKTRTLRQVARHMKALEEGNLVCKYGIPSGQDYVALFLFERQALAEKVQNALTEQIAFIPFREHFLFATVADSQRNVAGCWRKVGNTRFLFDFITGKPSFRLL